MSLAPIQAAKAQVPAPNTLPTSGQVTAGQAGITQSGSQLTVNQGSAQTIINWQSFSIGSQAAVTFNQPGASSVVLNRVVTGIPSEIFGKLTANGQVFLVNPGGILLGPGAQVNIGGLVATTMSISDADFLAGNYVFDRDGATSSVENQGSIAASPGGTVALLAPTVVNSGTITAPGGAVALAAGEQVTLALDGNVAVQVNPATVRTLIDNHGMIAAPDGRVILTSQALDTLLGGAINNSGVIEAGSIHNNGGVVTLDASGPLIDSGKINASGAKAGGAVTLTGNSIRLAGARIAASGGTGGGSIALGGGSTAAVSVDAASKLDASAWTSGNGGDIYVYGQSDRFAGTALATGGAQGGNGGQVETSGEMLDIAGARVNTSAPQGRAGNWLLDPFDLTVDAAAATTIANNLALSNVTLTTTATSTSGPGTVSAGAGDITVASAISAPLATNSLTLSAFHDVNIDATVTTGGDVTLRADNASIEGGTVIYGLGDTVVAGGTLSAYSGTGSTSAPTTGVLIDDTSSTTTAPAGTEETVTSTDPLATPLIEVSDSSISGTGTSASATTGSITTTTSAGDTTATATITPDTSTTSTEPTVETTPTETTVTAGETTATVGSTESTTSGTTSTTTETTASAGGTTATIGTGETTGSTATETTATAGGTTGTVTTGEASTVTAEPTVETGPTETTVGAGETTATVGTGTETTTTTEPTVSTTPTETTVTTGETTGGTTTTTETTATAGGTTGTVTTGEISTGTTEPTVETSPTETTIGTGETTTTVGTGGTTGETTVSVGGETSTGGTTGETGGTAEGTGGTGAQAETGSATEGAQQTAVLPQTAGSIRALRVTQENRELTQVVVEIGDASGGFRFALPENVTRDAHGSIAEMANGKNLPSWLVYHPENFSFTAAQVPERGLPVSVVVIAVRGNGTMHRISVALHP